ncbi:MAG: glucose-6-phosphate isomerase, partial [Wolbachia endosymbiont of Pissodes strobi]|nr:glucose-6-phosphate isomerase [Wolbachia endosymbiont of Pissodes strobi]
LGSLIAMYEHKIFVQGIIYNIYSFDQWGVELGKKLSNEILFDITNNNKNTNYDDSTKSLINLYKMWKKN